MKSLVMTSSVMKRPAMNVLPICLALAVLASLRLDAQVTYDRLLRAAEEPQNWITYNGGYSSQRYSLLTQITPANVTNLESKWVLQNEVFGAWQSNPIVVDGIMYVTQRPNDVMAVDAVTGRVFWQFRHTPAAESRVCCGANNRGVAILGDTLFLGTLDARLIAIDAKTGRAVWNVAVADVKQAYSTTMAPLIVKDKVLIGVGGGEFGIRGFVAAYDVEDRQGGVALLHDSRLQASRDSDTWSGDAWKNGGAPVWVTGSYDPALNLTYWGVGNPGPDWNPDQRPGDNLYSDSVIALDADTGALKWHFQFTPNDGYDYDSVQVPVLVDTNWQGKPAKLMLWANRNGFFYVLDRVTGKFLLGKPYVKVNWASGLDANGRPIQTRQPDGTADLSRQSRRHQLVSAVLQPAHGSLLLRRVGQLRHDLPEGRIAVQAWPGVPRRRLHRGDARARRARRSASDARSPINNWTERGRPRRRHGDRSADRRSEVEVPAVRRVRQRHADDGVGSAVHRRTRRLLPRARRAHRPAAVEGRARRADRDGTGDLRGRRQAIRVGHLRPHAGHVRPSMTELRS